jgi:competence protein ComEC
MRSHTHLTIILAVVAGCSSKSSTLSSSHPQPWGEDDAIVRVTDTGLDVGIDSAEPEYVPPDGIEFWFMNVGQGDATLIRFPSGATMLIDGGGGSSGKNVILPYLAQLNIDRLDYVVATHPDADHVGGLDDVVWGVDVAEVWLNGEEKTTYAWEDFEEAVDESGADVEIVHRGKVEYVGDCDVEVLNADQGHGEYNDNSIVLMVSCEGIRVLLPGDLGWTGQTDLVEEWGVDLKAEVAKIPHHGSSDHSAEYTSLVHPAVAVCSVGKGNSYGHPNLQVLQEWEEAGATVFRTDNEGTIVAGANDGKLTVTTAF